MLPWRLLGAGSLRLATRKALGAPSYAARAAAIGAWSANHDGAARAAQLVEALAHT
jgi:UDP:flavonoid glycosyltransferase YjiC (YdhE family)